MAARKKEKGKLSGLKDNGEPNAYWKRFKQRLEQYSDTPDAEWTAEHILGHIIKRYKDYTNMDWALSMSGPPTKCKEIYCVKRMQLALGSEDGGLAHKYVDYLFDTIIVPKHVLLTSVAFFFTPHLISEFKAKQYKERRASRITRTTQLPAEYESMASQLDLSISTYGDLAFAKMAIAQSPDNDDYKQYKLLIDNLANDGFDFTILDRLEDKCS
jgi:hypothetical protein